MFRRTFKRSFRGGGNKQRLKPHWIGTIDGGTALGAGNLAEIPIVVASDYASNVSISPSGVTVLRCVGNIEIIPNATPATSGATRLSVGLAHVDEDEIPAAGGDFDPTLSAQLVRQRWLWVQRVFRHMSTAVGDFPVISLPFDIKQKVRLRDSGISAIYKQDASSVQTVLISISARVLIVGDTT